MIKKIKKFLYEFNSKFNSKLKFSKKRNNVNENFWKNNNNEDEFEIDSKLLDTYDFKNLCSQCNSCNSNNNCNSYYKNIKKYNFIVIDDNYGVIESIKDIIEDLKSRKIISKDWGFQYYYTKLAPIYLLKDIKRKNYIPDAGLIDITYGSIIRINDKNIKINGVHIFDFILKINSDFKFYFYTGNTLNSYVKNINKMMNYFKKIYKKDMNNYILTKNFQDEKEIYNIIEKLIKDVEGKKL